MKSIIKKTILGLAIFAALLGPCFLIGSANVAAEDGPAGRFENTGTGPTNPPTTQQLQNSLQKNPIITDLQAVINVASAGVSLLIVGMIIYGGIRYALAGDNANHVTAARNQIIDAVFALIIFILMYGFLQWIVPGGLFNP